MVKNFLSWEYEIKPELQNLFEDPRISTRRKEFLRFVEEQKPEPENAKQGFKKYLGNMRVFRALCLVEGSKAYHRIFDQRILLSKCATQHSLEASIEKERKIGFMKGIRARLHQGEYEDSDFVFSVAGFPEPQIVPAIDSLNEQNKVYLLEFDMPEFDALPITIADIAGSKSNPSLFYHNGIMFNASDPNVERFVLHKTHMSNLTSRSFGNWDEIFKLCSEYNREMQKKYNLL